MEQQESIQFTDFGRILWNRRKIFVLTGFVSGILGVLISFILPVYYQSSATIFPAAISYVESTDLVYRRGNINEFGDTEQAEQLLEMFNSQNFQRKIIEKANLFDHYSISPERAQSNFKIFQRYRSLIKASRTRYNAVKLDVKDKSPEKAAEIVNLIVDELDDFRNEVIGRRIESHIITLEKSRDSLSSEWELWQDSLLTLQQRGVVGMEERAALLESLGNVRGNTTEIQERIDANFRWGAQFDIVEREVSFIQMQLNTIDKILFQWKTNAAEGVSQQFVFERGQIPDKKHSPKRLFVVLGVVGLALISMLFYLYGRENWPVIRERLET